MFSREENCFFYGEIYLFSEVPFFSIQENEFLFSKINFFSKALDLLIQESWGTNVLLQECTQLDFTENEWSVEWKFLVFQCKYHSRCTTTTTTTFIYRIDIQRRTVRILWQKWTESYIWSCNLTVIHYCIMSVGHSSTIRNSIAGSNETMN